MATQTISSPRTQTFTAEQLEAIRAEQAASEAAMNAQVVTSQGFTRGELLAAFNAVVNPKDVRGPIGAWVTGEMVTITVEAVKFFTATNPTVTLNLSQMTYLVASEGYRNGPAGDH